MDKYQLLGKGLFPETLPPCFDASDLKRALRGIVPALRAKKFFKRSSEPIPYNGTKHDGSRRWFSTVNPLQYFHICEFISKHWPLIDQRISQSPFVVSKPRPARLKDDRPIIIPSLSNLTTEASENLRYSPIIVRADISQFFPSVYTHILPWIAHGRDNAKKDQSPNSVINYFNALDYFVQHCQSSETRGIPVGPDAFRIIAEFIASDVDRKLSERIGPQIIGGARHVDDFFIGVRTETDAQIVLSALREVLASYHFQLNDLKTKITSGLEPLNDLWAQELRFDVNELTRWGAQREGFIRVLNKATELARRLGTDSPVKIVLRAYDDANIYAPYSHWKHVEPYLQRVCFHHPHCIDYVFLLVVKRFSLTEAFDKEGWQSVATELISRHSALGHDHEVVWSVWLMIVTGLAMPDDLMISLIKYDNVYVNSLLVSAYSEGKIAKRPKLSYGSGIASEGPRWLESLVARCSGFSKAKVSGAFSAEFLHFADKGLRLIVWNEHVEKMRQQFVSAISHTRYGYDSDDQDQDEEEFPF